MMSSFWWGQQGSERKIAWVSWGKMCTRKIDRGLGFKDLKDSILHFLLNRAGGFFRIHPPLSIEFTRPIGEEPFLRMVKHIGCKRYT